MCVRAAAVASSRDRRPPAAVTAATWTFYSQRQRAQVPLQRLAVVTRAGRRRGALLRLGQTHRGRLPRGVHGAREGFLRRPRRRVGRGGRGPRWTSARTRRRRRHRARRLLRGRARRGVRVPTGWYASPSNVRLDRALEGSIRFWDTLRPNRARARKALAAAPPVRGGAGRAPLVEAELTGRLRWRTRRTTARLTSTSCCRRRECLRGRTTRGSRSSLPGAQIRAFRCQDSLPAGSTHTRPKPSRASSNAR